MPIKKSISANVQVTSVDENAALHERAKDNRGVFDIRTGDPLTGSSFDGISDEPSVRAGALLGLAYLASETDEVPRPEDLKVQDLLTLARLGRNSDSIEYRYRNRITSPLSAIRAWCVAECRAGSAKAVRLCSSMDCPLWAFRMGQNGMRGRQ